jgi:hypothetical protein
MDDVWHFEAILTMADGIFASCVFWVIFFSRWGHICRSILDASEVVQKVGKFPRKTCFTLWLFNMAMENHHF